MAPDMSISFRYILWIWRFELLVGIAIVLALGSVLCWMLQSYFLLQECADRRRRPKLHTASSPCRSERTEGVKTL